MADHRRQDYWRQLFTAAWGLSRQHFAWVYPVVTTIVIMVLDVWIRGWDKALENLSSTLIAGGAGIVVAVAIFLVNLGRAASDIYADQLRNIDTLKKERDDARTQLALINKQSNNQRKEQIAKATEFVLAGFLLKQSVPGAIRDTPKDSLEEWKNKARQWRKDTAAFLETCSSVAALKFNDQLGIEINSGPLYINIHTDLQSQFDYLRQRLDILNEIIEKPDVYFKDERNSQ